MAPENHSTLEALWPIADAPSAPLDKGTEAAPKPLEIQRSTLSVRNLHEHRDLFPRYLRARRDVFIVEKGWQLPETDGMEFDQYDTPLARWIVIHDGEEVLGGARLLPTTAQCGSHSYMIRDAQLGFLPGLPTDLLHDIAPVTDDVWEATRLFVCDTVPSHARMAVQQALLLEMMSAAEKMGATRIIGIVPAVFKRWLKRIGLSAKEAGPVMRIDGDRVQAAYLSVMQARPGTGL